EDGAVTIEDTFGVARRARGIAHGGGCVLVEGGPLVGSGLAADEGLVINGGLEFAGRVGSIAHDDVQFHRWKLISELFQYWHEVPINKDHLIFSVVDDVDQLLSKETDIERV